MTKLFFGRKALFRAFLLSALTLAFTACTKPSEETVDDNPPDFKIQLPVKITEREDSDVTVSTISYINNTNIIKSISSKSTGPDEYGVITTYEDKEELFYNDKNQPVRLEESDKDGVSYRVNFTLDEYGNVVRGDEYYKDVNQMVPGGYFTYTYNSNNQVISINYFDVDNNKKVIYDYDNNQNVLTYRKISYLFPGTNDDETETYNLTYDNTSNPFKDTKNFFLLDGILDIIFVPSANNLTKITKDGMPDEPVYSENRSYQHDIANFPVKMNVVEKLDGITQRNWSAAIEYKMQ